MFFGASVLMFFAFILFRLSKINDNNIVKRPDRHILLNFIKYFQDKNRTLAYILGGGVTLWWALIYIYIPLYILEHNLDKIWIGIFLFAVAVPLIFFEYTFAKLSGKMGSRVLFQMGYFILTLTVILCFFVSNPFYVLSLLVFASFGVAMLEPTTEAYFFDVLKNKKEENRFYGPYNTTIESGLIIGKFSPAVLLLFLPFNYIFLLFGLFTFSLFIFASVSKNIVEAKK